MNRAAQQRAAIRRLTESLTTPLSPEDVEQIVVEEARRLTDAASAALCLLAPEGDMLDFVAAAGENAALIVGLRIRLNDSLSEPVIATGRCVLLDARPVQEAGDLFTSAQEPLPAVVPRRAERRTADALSAPLHLTASPGDKSASTRSAAVVPLIRNGRIVGTLSASNKTADGSAPTPAFPASPMFDQDDLEILTMLAEFAGLSRAVDYTFRLAREQSRELAVLYDAAHTIAGSLNVQEVMDSVLAAICTHLEHHTAILFLLNDERSHLFIAAERGLTEDEREIQFSVESGAHARVLDSGIPRLIEDTDTAEDFEPFSERAHALSAMIAPIRSRDETHGLILVTSLQRRAYHPDDLKLLSAVGMQAGIAIENAWLYEDAQRQAEEATALYDLSQHVNATLHLDRVLNFVAESVLNLLKVDKFALLLYDKEEGRLVTRLSRNVDESLFANMRPRIGEGIAGWVFKWQTPQAVSDVAADARNRSAPIDQADVASTLCVPMQVGEDVIGVIHAMSSKRRLFTVAEMELLYTIANQAAFAIVNAMQYQEARAKSYEMRRYFRRVAQAIGSAVESQNLPQLLADLAIEIMRADRCAIYRIDGDTLRLQSTSHFRPTVPPDESMPLGFGLAGSVAKRGQSLVLANLDDDPRSRAHAWLNRERLTSYLAVPLKSGRQTVGVIEIYTQERRAFSPEEVQLLSMFTRRARLSEKIAMASV